MDEREEPESISKIKKEIQEGSEATGIVDSLLIEGIEASLELVRRDIKPKNPEPIPPDGEKNTTGTDA